MTKITNLVIGDLRLVESGKEYGNLSANPLFFKESDKTIIISRDRNKIRVYKGKRTTKPSHDKQHSIIVGTAMAHRVNFGVKNGFLGRQMYIASQEKGNGEYQEITEKMVRQQHTAEYMLDTDILVITDKTPNIAIGALTNTTPVAMIYDEKQKILVAAHISNNLKINNVPERLCEILVNDYNGDKSNMHGIITINSESYPNLMLQFQGLNLGNYYFSPINTESDSRYFHLNEGLGFSGAYIKGEKQGRVKSLSL